ncbi:MAG: zf-HC2 domain-containing protein [Acidobacteriota bacterium]|jgi:anti-sigma factor RsiW|nr:zf-HC2 domain-containing protein [Acidobacteriota bacterium]
MNCKDFKDIADSYLSNELLVETNHDVLRHLESCPECRDDLAALRELRQRLQVAVKDAQISQMNAGFAATLRSGLREQALGKDKYWSIFVVKAAFAGSAAVLLIALAVGLTMRNSDAFQTAEVVQSVPVSSDALSPETFWFQRASFVEAQNDAVEDHKHCALTHDLKEKPISLEKAAKLFGTADDSLGPAVIGPLRETFGNDAKFVMAHFCIISGRHFSHVVVQYREKVVSVLLTKREEGDVSAHTEAVSCKTAEDFRVACFESGKYNVFVISDLRENENLLFAQTISASVKNHIGQNNGAA